MKILGHCRFSYFGLTDTGRAVMTLEDAHAKLWEPRRMAVRFHLFEHLMLPSIVAQTDRDFSFVIVTTAAMPDMYHDRLARLTQGIYGVTVVRATHPDYTNAARPVTVPISNGFQDPVIHFRIDDDDAVSAGYVAKLRDAARRVDPGGMVTFPKGIVGMVDGETARHNHFAKHSIAIGLAIVAPPNSGIHPFRLQHAKHSTRVPSYTDPTFLAYHYTLHTANVSHGFDTNFNAAGERNPHIMANRRHLAEHGDGVTTPEVDAALAEAFPFTDGPTLRAHLSRTADPAALAEEMGFL